jgi:hypothetical protein
MNRLSKTLFGKLYYYENNQSHFKLSKSKSYCETFFMKEQYMGELRSIYGIVDFKYLPNNELYSNLIIGDKDNIFKLQERYRFTNNIESIFLQNFDKEITYDDINKNILEIMLQKNNSHIITCSCCHRY